MKILNHLREHFIDDCNVSIPMDYWVNLVDLIIKNNYFEFDTKCILSKIRSSNRNKVRSDLCPYLFEALRRVLSSSTGH